MRAYVYFLFLFIILSCSSTQEKSKHKTYPAFNIITTPFLVEKDTILINELRFYDTKSAKDAMKLMYLDHGKWTKKLEGIHQKILKRFVWKNVKLLNKYNDLFTVIAGGVESNTNYFTYLTVIDATQKDCLDENHTFRNILTDHFTSKMKRLDTKKIDYKIFN